VLGASPQRAGLGRSFHQLQKTRALTIGYFGGSITAGSGASKPAETSYRALTTKWFRDNFPEAKITEVNAAIGGTGSDLGAFRCQKDLLDQHPDLVFVEFAVNDGGANPARIERSMEGIVRQIWRANPAADIVFVYTVAKSLGAIYDRGETPPSVIADEKIAAAYRIPSINMGKTLWQLVHDGKATWADLLPDNTHPNDRGYRIYQDQISAFLEAHRRDKNERPLKKLPPPVSQAPLDHGHLIEGSEIGASGWQHDDSADGKRFPHNIAANQPGTELKYRFQGTAIGLYWVIAPDSGDVEWSVDGSAPKRVSSWDSYALRFSRVNYKILDDGLAAGEHELVLRVLAEKNAQSKGTWIRLGALMVN
jgi:lysophospholipase L1-like esterase